MRARRGPDGRIPILFVHSQSGFGADSAVHGHLMRYLDRDRFRVHVACPPDEPGTPSAALARFREIPGVTVRETRFVPGVRHRSRDQIARQIGGVVAFPVDTAALAAYVAREQVAVIHGTDRPRDALYSVALGRLTGARSVVHVHVAWARGYAATARWGVHNASGVFAISRFVARTVVDTGTPARRVHTVLNGIDVGPFDPTIDGRGVRRALGVPDGVPLVASVSRLFAQKGQRELVRAFAKVAASMDARLAIVGADAVEVHGGSFTAELKALARELGVTDRVIFTGPRTDVPAIMAACEVFSLPSFEEPFGLVYLEAMAMRRPVVSIDNGGTPEVVEHGRSGLLAPQGDIDALASHLSTLLRDPDLRARMGEHGRARVLSDFTAQRMARDAAAAYDAVLETP